MLNSDAATFRVFQQFARDGDAENKNYRHGEGKAVKWRKQLILTNIKMPETSCQWPSALPFGS